MKITSDAMTWMFTAAFAATIASTGCAHWSPTGPDAVTPPGGGTFSGTVYPDGQTVWPFDLVAPGTLTVRLVALDPASLTVGLGIGEKITGGCSVAQQTQTGPGDSAPQITLPSVSPGSKCALVFDIGGVPLTGARFTVDIRAF